MEGKYDEPDEKHGNAVSSAEHTIAQTHTTPAYYIQTSTIAGAGYGFFANKRYKKGERIIVYTGEIITEALRKTRYPKNDARYLVYVMHDTYIDAIDVSRSSDARYINSSGGGYNNAAMHPQHTNNTHTINIVATHDIAPGEEVFMPYGSSYHMSRAPRPNRKSMTTATSEWEQHMHAPPKKHDDGRVKWRINENVDWSLFRANMEPQLDTWMQTYKQWMPPQQNTQQQQQQQQQQQHAQRAGRVEGTLHVVMYTDGASRGNPGAASCGGVIYLAKDKLTSDTDATAQPIHSFSTTLGRATNNEAEYNGLLQALEAACEMGATHVHAHVDSQLMCRQIQGQYQARDSKLMPIYEQCKIHITQLHTFNITHIPRKLNKEADKLCNDALDAWATWADEIPDMMHGEETGLNDGQKQNTIQAQQQQQQKQDEQNRHDADEKNKTSRPAHITQEEIDTCWKGIHDTIMSAADASIGQVTNRPKSKYWWAIAPNIHAIHDKMRKKRRTIRKMKRMIQHSLHSRVRHNITPAQLAQTRQEYRDAKKEFNSSILKAKNAEWKQVTAACVVCV
jgi:ribonuclease HI